MRETVVELESFVVTKSGFGNLTQPYCICFVYAPEGNFVVKGMQENVEAYVASKFPICLYHKTYWRDGVSRGLWLFNGIKAWIYKRGRKWQLHISINGEVTVAKTFRRIPKRWIDTYERADRRDKSFVKESDWIS